VDGRLGIECRWCLGREDGSTSLCCRLPLLQYPLQCLLQLIRLLRIRVLVPVVLPTVVEHEFRVREEVLDTLVVIVVKLVLHRR